MNVRRECLVFGIAAAAIVSPLRGQAVRELTPEQRAAIDA
jgi:hypothetical protein